jgi:hypothetical protein
VGQGLDMETTFGSGFSIINNDGHFPQDELIKLTNITLVEVERNRCKFLGKCIHVERVLGNLINCFFVREDKERSEIFTQLITSQSFFSFRARKQVIVSLISNYPQYFKNIKNTNDIEKFSKKVEKIVEIRNLLAHGELLLDFKEKKVKIAKYSLNIRDKSIETLDSDFFDKWEQDIAFIFNFCMICSIFLKTNQIIPTDENYAPLQKAFIF